MTYGYKNRVIDKALDEITKVYNAVCIVGPKGCGKTTTAKQRAKTVIEFQGKEQRDNLLAIASISPSQLLKKPKPFLFDEWQDAPKIWVQFVKTAMTIRLTLAHSI